MILKKRIDHLHIIRGLASLLVVIFHSRFVLWCGGTEYNKIYHPPIEKCIAYLFMLFFSSGRPMVICFFVLSGFFMQLSFSNNTIKRFYQNRGIRIYVPYIANTILTSIILYTCINYINPNLKVPFDSTKEIAVTPLISFNELNLITFFKSLIFLPGKQYIAWNTQYWSLLYEGIFYLTIPILVLKKTPTLIGAFVAYIIGYFYTPENILLQYLFNFLVFFQIGICLNLFIDKNEVENIFNNKRNLKYIISACILVYLGSCSLELMKQDHLACLLGGVLAVILVLFFYHQPEYIFKMKVYKWLKKLGDISFSLYLNHIIILYLIYTVITKVTGEYLIYLPIYILAAPITILFSYVFYVLIEKPSLKIKNRL